MDNIHSIGKGQYEAAKPLEKPELIQHIIFVAQAIGDMYKCVFFIFARMFKSLIQSSKPKTIKNQLALVTGGANGLGRQIAMRLASEKCNIVIADLDEVNGRQTAIEITEKFGVHCEAFCVDLTDYLAVEKLRNKIREDIGIVDIIVNNAGIVPSVSLMEKDWTDVDRIIKVNLYPHLWVSEYSIYKFITIITHVMWFRLHDYF